MKPGIDRHYEERARFERRLSLILLVASAIFTAPFIVLVRSPDLRATLNDPVRFGFAGPEQYVRRIQLSMLGDPRAMRREAQMVTPSALLEQKRGGGDRANPAADAGLPTSEADPFRPPGLGDSEEDILARARLRAGTTPLFQSRELVIEHLVEPIYPEAAKAKGIEGRVAVLALVDRAGNVKQAEVVGTAGEKMLERAAVDAVMQCRFEPFLVNGETREVYAMFRFVFRLLN